MEKNRKSKWILPAIGPYCKSKAKFFHEMVQFCKKNPKSEKSLRKGGTFGNNSLQCRLTRFSLSLSLALSYRRLFSPPLFLNSITRQRIFDI